MTVVAGSEPPAGWLGKPWACAQGAARARGEWLCFTDADVRFAPPRWPRRSPSPSPRATAGRRSAPASCARRSGSARCSRSRRSRSPPWSRHPRSPSAPARRSRSRPARSSWCAATCTTVRAATRRYVTAWRTIWPWGARSSAPAGCSCSATATTCSRCACTTGIASSGAGWRKNAAYGLPGGVPAAFAGGASAALGALVPPLALICGIRRGDRALACRGGLGLAALVALRASDRRTAPTPPAYALTAPLGVAWIAAVTFVAALDRARGGSRWRGRRYSFAR